MTNQKLVVRSILEVSMLETEPFRKIWMPKFEVFEIYPFYKF